MKAFLLLAVLVVAVIWALSSGYESIKSKAYSQGYDAGLHDGEIYFCDDIRRKSDTIYSWLKRERMC